MSLIRRNFQDTATETGTTAPARSKEMHRDSGSQDDPLLFERAFIDARGQPVKTIMWVEDHWAYYTTKCEERRKISSLVLLETEILGMVKVMI